VGRKSDKPCFILCERDTSKYEVILPITVYHVDKNLFKFSKITLSSAVFYFADSEQVFEYFPVYRNLFKVRKITLEQRWSNWLWTGFCRFGGVSTEKQSCLLFFRDNFLLAVHSFNYVFVAFQLRGQKPVRSSYTTLQQLHSLQKPVQSQQNNVRAKASYFADFQKIFADRLTSIFLILNRFLSAGSGEVSHPHKMQSVLPHSKILEITVGQRLWRSVFVFQLSCWKLYRKYIPSQAMFGHYVRPLFPGLL